MVVIKNIEKSELLNLKGFTQIKTKKDYEVLRLKKDGVVLTLYSSKKLLIQGKDADKFASDLNIKIGKPYDSLTVIGTDETLKGDTFGGIVVSGVKANPKERKELKKFVFGDSKKIDDKMIPILAKKIMNNFNYNVQELKPKEYNDLVKQYGLTGLLNVLHQRCNDNLKSKDSVFIVDKFPGCTVGDKAVFKADEKYVEVASASIIARYIGLKQIDILSKEVGFKIPLGSTHVLSALKRLQKQNFSHFVKLNFKNVKRVLNQLE